MAATCGGADARYPLAQAFSFPTHRAAELRDEWGTRRVSKSGGQLAFDAISKAGAEMNWMRLVLTTLARVG